jgi:uncharacterized YigZ family protein
MPDGGYITLAGRARAELTEKKSVFIATAAPVADEAEAKELIASVRAEFPDARHHVYAYWLNGGAVARCSDDGEPQGTGGVPVLNVLRMSGATELCAVVTRYFGGILLGAGGLVRAYSAAARLALDRAGLVTLTAHTVYSVRCSYAEYPRLTAALARFSADEPSAAFGAEVDATAVVPNERRDEFFRTVSELTGGKASVTPIGGVQRPRRTD